MTSTRAQRWNPALAGYRALAALSVYVFHIASIDAPGGIIGRWTTPLGNAAVSLFFVLSGYLIYRPFAEWALLDGPRVPMFRFIVRRVVRIVPLYWVVLTLHLFVLRDEGRPTLDEAVTAYALVQNFRGPLVFVPPFVAWSLCIELWFSVALPVIAGILRRLGDRHSPRNRLAVQLFGVAFMATAAIVFRIWALGGPDDSGRILWMPAYLDWFAGGLTLALLTTHWTRFAPPPTVRRFAAHPWLLGVIGLVAYWTVTQIGLPGSFIAPTAFQTHAQFLLEGLTSTTLVTAAVLPRADLGRAGRFLGSPVLSLLGSLSFGIYLVHPVVADAIRTRWPSISLVVLAVVALIITIAVSWVLHRLVEAPASTSVDRWLGGGRRPEPVVAIGRPDAEPLDAEPLDAEPREVEPREVEPREVEPREVEPREVEPREVELEDLELLDVEPPDIELPVVAPTSTVIATERQGLVAGSLDVGPGTLALVLCLLSLVATVASRPGRYVADARYELFSDPATRLARLGTIWDASRDIGRPAEEFWPGLTALAGFFHLLTAPPWLNERLIHAVLLSVASCGAMLMSRALGERRSVASLLVGLLYGFGPFSAVFLVPSPLYVAHALAPWMVLAVIAAANGRHAGVASAGVALALFAAGNADPPGLVLCLVPAILTWIGLFAVGRERRRLATFAGVTTLATLATSAAMIVKTSVGSAALAHRLLETETPSVIAATSSFTESLRGMGFWLTYLRVGPTRFRLHHEAFIGDPLTILVTFTPLVIGLAMMSRTRTRRRLLALTWVLSGVTLMVGAHPIDRPSPLGRIMSWGYDHSELAYGFRSTHKAGVVLTLGVAVLAGWAMADLIDLARARGPRPFASSIVVVVALLAALTRPFWATDLYDRAATSTVVPDYWSTTAGWFREHPPAGRVLVLPGSTNTAYRWGSVGDDLLDPIVPHRVVASTLPLSTAIAADLVQATNDALTDPNYRAGTAAAMARRLGVTDIVIRNDVDWERQSLARPADLGPLRADPDLELVASFGPQGLYSARPLAAPPVDGEELLAPVEIYHVRGVDAGALRVVQSADGRPLLGVVDGDGSAVANLAALGLIDDRRPIAFAGQLDTSSLGAIAQDVGRVVLTDTNQLRDRRISYFDFDFAVPASVDGGIERAQNRWLTGFADGDVTTVSSPGYSVGSSVNRWLMGLDHAAGAVTDGEPTTWWAVPALTQDRPGSWWIEWSEPIESGTVTIRLKDLGHRIGSIEVSGDGESIARGTADDIATGEFVVDVGAIRRLTITLADFGPGVDPIGLTEVELADRSLRPSVQLSPHLTDLIAGDASIQDALIAASVTVMIGSPAPPSPYLSRTFELWRTDDFEVVATSNGEPIPECRSDVVAVDGTPVAIRTSAGPDGSEVLRSCGERLSLGAGRHEVSVTPPSDTAIGLLALTSERIDDLSLVSTPVQSGGPISLKAGQYLLGSASQDERWTFGDADRVQTVSLDGQIGWRAVADIVAAPPVFAPERQLPTAWALSIAGGVGAVLLGVVGDRRRRAAAPAVQAVRADRPGRRPGDLVVAGLGLGLAFVVGGAAGLAGAFVAVVIGRWLGAWRMFPLSAAVLVGVAVATALPVVGTDRSIVDPTVDDGVSRAVVGALVVALFVAARGVSSAAHDVDDAIPGGELP